MANHVLSLEVPFVMNSCVMKIFDTSVYTVNPLLPVTCPTLNITVPGFSYSNQIEGAVMTDFVNTGHITLTACDLQLQTANCGSQYVDLPDGIYIIKYSVSPNDQVYIDANACDPPAKIKQKLEELRFIKMYLDAAISKVEFCHEPQKGMSLYNYAMKLLNKMTCTNC